MKKIDLLRAINDIDDDMILEAAPGRLIRKKKAFWLDYRFLAACASVMVLAIIILPGMNQKKTSDYMGPGAVISNPTNEKVEADFLCPETFRDNAVVVMTTEDSIIAEYYDGDENRVLTITRTVAEDTVSTDSSDSTETSERIDQEIKSIGNDSATKSYNGSQLVYEVTWYEGEYCYTIVSEDGLTREEVDELMDSVR